VPLVGLVVRVRQLLVAQLSAENVVKERRLADRILMFVELLRALGGWQRQQWMIERRPRPGDGGARVQISLVR